MTAAWWGSRTKTLVLCRPGFGASGGLTSALLAARSPTWAQPQFPIRWNGGEKMPFFPGFCSLCSEKRYVAASTVCVDGFNSFLSQFLVYSFTLFPSQGITFSKCVPLALAGESCVWENSTVSPPSWGKSSEHCPATFTYTGKHL